MEERLMIYVYCGKLVKLMKEYKEEFIYDFDYNKYKKYCWFKSKNEGIS